MKVGVFLDEYLPEDGGGYTMQSELFRALCRNCNQTNHQFVTISKPNSQAEIEAKKAGITWLSYQGPGIIEQISTFFARIWPKLRGQFKWRSSFELMARAAGIEYIWFLGPRPQAVDLPYLAIVLDLQHRKQPWFPEVSDYGEWETRERLIALFLRRAAGIIVGTSAGKREVTQFFQVPDNRVHILPHPTPDYVNTSLPSNNVQEKFDLTAGYLFYPAQFWAHKNHVNLLLAIKQLVAEGLNIPLVLVGSDFGNLDYIGIKAEELGLSHQVKILGFVDVPDLIALYKNALALTYVSLFGPENLPPLEAFALGCPVIAAKVDGSEEQLGNAALLVDPKKPEEIAGAIRRLYKDTNLRNELIARGHQRAAKWTADNFVNGVFSILDEFEPIRRNWGK